MKSSGVCIADCEGFQNSILNGYNSEAKNNFDTVVFDFCCIARAFEKQNKRQKKVKLDQFCKKLLIWFLIKFKEIAHFNLSEKKYLSIMDHFYSKKAKAKTPIALLILQKKVSCLDIGKPTERTSNRIASIASKPND